METSKTILFVIIILVVFLIGGGIGILYQSNQSNISGSQAQKNAVVVKDLSSNLVPSVVAYGQVADIQGKELTLSFSGDTLKVLIRDDAQISTIGGLAPSAKTTTSNQAGLNFSDIKTGDSVSVNMKLSADGVWEGVAVFILPASAATK